MKIQKETRATVIEHKIGRPLKRTDFRLEFPPGIEVPAGQPVPKKATSPGFSKTA